MVRHAAAFAFAATIAAIASPASAQRVEAGMLECSGTSTSFIVGSVTELRCSFKSADGRVDPAQALRGCGLDPRGDRLDVVGPVGAPADVGECGLGTLGDDERVVQELAPPAQEDRPARARRLLEAEHLRVEADGLLGRRSEDLDVGELGEQTLGHG